MLSSPSIVTVPADLLTMPQTILISVVLPAPLGPSSAKISPFSISRSMGFSASNPDAYVLATPLTEMIDTRARSLVEGMGGHKDRNAIAPALPSERRLSASQSDKAAKAASGEGVHAPQGMPVTSAETERTLPHVPVMPPEQGMTS